MLYEVYGIDSLVLHLNSQKLISIAEVVKIIKYYQEGDRETSSSRNGN